ncbi:MAG TPA: M23 family metallopeptidase [Kofleriaceae bacterium]|jgi:hypothetical protein
MSATPWVIGGGVVAGLWYWSRHRNQDHEGASARHSHHAVAPDSLPGRWVWPLPRLDGRPPAISDGFDSPRTINGERVLHGGVDLMYARLATEPYKGRSPYGSRGFVMPANRPVLAASDGVIWSVDKTPRGIAIVIDHGPRKIATFYQHLASAVVTAKAKVAAGDVLGVAGADPTDPEGLVHLHFEVWLGGPDDRIDPAALMRQWEIRGDTVRAPTPAPKAAKPPLVARNARLTFRPVGKDGEPYPQWVRDLKNQSGVYVFRERQADGTEPIVYVGVSLTNLYRTMTRHLQDWSRDKRWWKGEFTPSEHDPGVIYRRARITAAATVMEPDAAIEEELRLIQKLGPRDNIIGHRIDDEPPF